MPYTEFHYTPTGTGVISGKEVLEQTEDAINDLGGQISGDVQTAIDTANNALNTANTASADAQNAVNTANTAYTAATNAQNTANAAQNTASNALTAAQNAQNDVNALGNRVTTAEGNITQNTNAITGLTTRMGTAEGNITTLQNDVITAQGTATSAQNTATLARGQAYVVRYASVAVSDNSTVPYTDLSNIDNVKANDLLLDTNGKLYQISSVDTSNETVSVTTPLTQLAVDSGVMHLSGNETKSGELTLSATLKSSDIVPLTNLNFSLGSPDYKYYNVYAYMYNSIGRYFGNEANSNQRTNITLYANRDTQNQSCAYITRFRQNRAQGALQPTDLQKIGFDVLENEVRTNDVFDIQCTDWLNNVPQRVNFVSSAQSFSFGHSLKKALINGINPSSLGMPDLSNGIDISSYLTAGNSNNTYTPPANGWISISLGIASGGIAIFIEQGDMKISSYSNTAKYQDTNISCFACLPVVAGVEVNIGLKGNSNYINSAKFFPCQGNV